MPAAAPVAAGAVPAAPSPAILAVPEIQPLVQFPYQITVDGHEGGGVFVFPRTMPSFTIAPGKDFTASLDVTIPPGEEITGMFVDLMGNSAGAQFAIPLTTPYNDSTQVTAPGTHVFELPRVRGRVAVGHRVDAVHERHQSRRDQFSPLPDRGLHRPDLRRVGRLPAA